MMIYHQTYQLWMHVAPPNARTRTAACSPASRHNANINGRQMSLCCPCSFCPGARTTRKQSVATPPVTSYPPKRLRTRMLLPVHSCMCLFHTKRKVRKLYAIVPLQCCEQGLLVAPTARPGETGAGRCCSDRFHGFGHSSRASAA